MKNKVLTVAVALALSGCTAPPLDDLKAHLKALAVSLFQSKGQAALRQALRHYEEGDHAAALHGLNAALELGLEPADRVAAHKHLAFIHCAAERRQQCRAEFQLALQADPRTDLDPAEAGHPAWGPVFRSVAR